VKHQMNEPKVPHAKVTRNPGDPLRAAQLHNFALRLDLRRARRDPVGSHKIATIDRLLHVNAAVARSLEWLNGKADATHYDFEALPQFAIEPGTSPDPVEAVSQ